MGTASVKCTSCKTPIPNGAASCPTCGSAVPSDLLQEAERPRANLGRSGDASRLPPDLMDRAAQRLGIAALLYAVVYLLAYLSARLAMGWGGLYWYDVIPAAFIVLSLAVVFLVRFGSIDGRQLLNIGLVYEVIGAAGIDIQILFLRSWPEGIGTGGASWTCVWIVMFPLIVPSPPGKTLLAALAAAAMQPLMYAIVVARGLPPLPWSVVLAMATPAFICAGLAVVGSRVIYRLGSDIDRERRMGGYRLIARLGEGGMGEVWRAKHRLLARPAAIKLIRPEMLGAGENNNSAATLKRFEREAQATAMLQSPHTVELFDFGITNEGTLYYVMELLDGLDLKTLVERFGPLPPQRAVHLLRQVCGSLGEAHEHGLIHRDIKPANIFTCRYGREVDFVKVLDFGLVKSDQDSGQKNVTATGVAMGTPGTMAPEQILTGITVDARMDIYGLGCVGYWLLTGTPVFEGKTVHQLLAHHIQTVPTPPSERVKRAVPEALDEAILACLEKDPNQRPTADSLLDMLTLCVDEGGWTAEKANEWWSERIPEETVNTGHEQRILMPSLVGRSHQSGQ